MEHLGTSAYRQDWDIYYDSLYGYVLLHPRIRAALDLRLMQRLRHIKQLSTVPLVFSGANHTRFEHSVGVYHLATHVFDTLRLKYGSDDRFATLFTPVKKLALQLAALFHDLGHGPTSHTFELFCTRCLEQDTLGHEAMTTALIEGNIPDHRSVYEFLTHVHTEVDESRPDDRDVGLLEPACIAALARGQAPGRYKNLQYLGQIISSSIDVDKMDYLRRDALNCGLGTGSVDVWGIIHNFVVYEDKAVWNAGLSSDAAPILEAFLATRDHAYRQIYYQKTHRIAQELVIAALCDLTRRDGGIEPKKVALMTDDELFAAFQNPATGTPLTKKVADRILYRQVYECLPIEVKVHEDLDRRAVLQWKEYSRPKRKGDYETFMAGLRTLAVKLGMPEAETVIFDMPRTPVMKREAFTDAYFVDRDSGKVRSLLDLCPHLNLTYGSHRLPTGEVLDLYALYEELISTIRFAVPPEFLDAVLRKAYTASCRALEGRPRVDPLLKALRGEISASLDPILLHFMNTLGVSDEIKREALSSRFRTAMIRSLIDRLLTRWQIDGSTKQALRERIAGPGLE